MIFEYSCVAITLLFCIWGFYIAMTTRPPFFPLGRFGRCLLIVNSLALGAVCWATLAFKLIEILK